MKLPSMKYRDRITRTTQAKFGGLNMSAGAGDGEITSMINMTGDHYPAIGTRGPRYLYKSCEADSPDWSESRTIMAYGGEQMYWTRAGYLYCENVAIAELQNKDGSGTRDYRDTELFVPFGSNFLIFPQKYYVHKETDEAGKEVFLPVSADAKWVGPSASFSDGTLFGEPALANTVTINRLAAMQAYCYGTLEIGDAVVIAGCRQFPENNGTYILREMEVTAEHWVLRFDENCFHLPDGLTYTENGVSAYRDIPDLKFACQCGNRMWGCDDRTIYASKLGDPTNWNVYDGLETDSWTLTPDTEGSFTGCISYGGYPIFFKETCIHKVYGNSPSNFEVTTEMTHGVERSSGRSLAVAGGLLYYLSPAGVMAYGGGTPWFVGEAYGTMRLRNGIGGSDGVKYYLCAQSADDPEELDDAESEEDRTEQWIYVLSTRNGMWHREGAENVTQFFNCGTELYMVDQPYFARNVYSRIWVVGRVNSERYLGTEENPFDWEVCFGNLTDGDPNKKAISKILVRMELEAGATAEVWLYSESNDQWQMVGEAMEETAKRSWYLPVIPRRNDHHHLRIQGTGGCKIYSITREYYVGSALRSRIGRH